MSTQQPVGVGDFVLLDKIDLENFMNNLELRYALLYLHSIWQLKICYRFKTDNSLALPVVIQE